VLAAIARGAKRYGLSVAASRTTTGNHVVYEQLEAELARFFGVPSALLLSNGYLTNIAVTQALACEFTAAFIDEQAHGSLQNAAAFLNCPVVPFGHRDPGALARALPSVRGGKFILLTDGMFPRDGALALLGEYTQVLPASAVLLVDDAHAAGVHGPCGRGTPELEGVSGPGTIQTLTLSKAFGTFGGVVLGTKALCRGIVEKSAVFAGSTPVPLPLAEGAREALKLLANPSLRERLHRRVVALKGPLIAAGLLVPNTLSPVIALQGRSGANLGLVRRRLRAAGIHAPWVRYGSADGHPYLRFTVSSEHRPEHIAALVHVLVACRSSLTVFG